MTASDHVAPGSLEERKRLVDSISKHGTYNVPKDDEGKPLSKFTNHKSAVKLLRLLGADGEAVDAVKLSVGLDTQRKNISSYGTALRHILDHYFKEGPGQRLAPRDLAVWLPKGDGNGFRLLFVQRSEWDSVRNRVESSSDVDEATDSALDSEVSPPAQTATPPGQPVMAGPASPTRYRIAIVGVCLLTSLAYALFRNPHQAGSPGSQALKAVPTSESSGATVGMFFFSTPTVGGEPISRTRLLDPSLPAQDSRPRVTGTDFSLDAQSVLHVNVRADHKQRLGIALTSAKRHYVYLFDQETFEDGSMGPANLIHPYQRQPGGRPQHSEISPGRTLLLPDERLFYVGPEVNSGLKGKRLTGEYLTLVLLDSTWESMPNGDGKIPKVNPQELPGVKESLGRPTSIRYLNSFAELPGGAEVRRIFELPEDGYRRIVVVSCSSARPGVSVASFSIRYQK